MSSRRGAAVDDVTPRMAGLSVASAASSGGGAGGGDGGGSSSSSSTASARVPGGGVAPEKSDVAAVLTLRDTELKREIADALAKWSTVVGARNV